MHAVVAAAALLEDDEAAPRVLVLGSEDHGRDVRAYSWRALPDGLNVADFDVVILNFVSLEDEWTRTNVPLDRLPGLGEFTRLILSENAFVVAIGDPGLDFGQRVIIEGAAPGADSYLKTRNTTWWLPVGFRVSRLAGEAITNIEPDWQFWFEHVQRYEWHFDGQPTAKDDYDIADASAVLPIGLGIAATSQPLATTRYGAALGQRVTLSTLRVDRPRLVGEGVFASTPVFWLPKTTDLDHREAIDLLLRRLDIHHEEVKPGWLGAHRLPDEVDAAEQLERAREALAAAEDALEEAKQAASHAARFGKLLYEQGREALEPIVREALAELGADVRAPAVEGIEDGRLIDPQGRPMMLEVKGRRGQLRRADVSQLDGWIRSAMADEGWEGRGLIVANLKLGEDPATRADLVPPNARELADRFHIAIVLATDVWKALEAKQHGLFDEHAFWDAIAGASGVIRLFE